MSDPFCAHRWRRTGSATIVMRCMRCGVLGQRQQFGRKLMGVIFCACGAAATVRREGCGCFCVACAPAPPGNLRTLRGGDFSAAEVAEFERLYMEESHE